MAGMPPTRKQSATEQALKMMAAFVAVPAAMAIVAAMIAAMMTVAAAAMLAGMMAGIWSGARRAWIGTWRGTTDRHLHARNAAGRRFMMIGHRNGREQTNGKNNSSKADHDQTP